MRLSHTEKAILATIEERPMTATEIHERTGLAVKTVQKALTVMLASREVEVAGTDPQQRGPGMRAYLYRPGRQTLPNRVAALEAKVADLTAKLEAAR